VGKEMKMVPMAIHTINKITLVKKCKLISISRSVLFLFCWFVTALKIRKVNEAKKQVANKLFKAYYVNCNFISGYKTTYCMLF
jgi:hypothetical protein